MSANKNWSWLVGANSGSDAEMLARKIIGIIWIIAIPVFIAVPPNVVWKIDDSAAECVPYRPASTAYAVTWGLLIAMLVISWWVFSRSKTSLYTWIFVTIMFLIVITTAAVWSYAYAKESKEDAVTVFIYLIIEIVLLIPILWSANPYSCAFLLPLLVWASFQMNLAMDETECSS